MLAVEYEYKMQCLTPITIKNPQIRTKQEDLYIHVPCGKCSPCLKRRAATWVFRLKKQDEISETSVFITYTYNDLNIPISENGYPTLDRAHHTLYMKRLRKQLKKEGYTGTLKYYLVGEYGSMTHRPHYHSILFNLPQHYINNPHKVEKSWTHGNIQIDEVTPQSIAYVCGYVNKQKHFSNFGETDDRTPEFNFMSKGLGENYLTPAQIESMKRKLNPYITTENGQKTPMPRYYKDKVFTPEEKTKLADKALAHIEKNNTFDTELQKQNYILADSKKRNKIALHKRNKL